MKERFIELLDSVGYPYRSLNAVDKIELIEIHKAEFNKNSTYYRDRTCSSCYIGMLNDLIVKFDLPRRNEISRDYETRMSICRECSATKGQEGNKILICGKLGKPSKGKHKTCGCILNIKNRLKSQKCPRDKF